MSSSSNSSLFPPKQGDSTSPTTSRETGLSGTTPSSPFGSKTGESTFSSRFATPTLKPAGATSSPQTATSGALGNPFSKPALSALSTPTSPLGKTGTSPAPTSAFGSKPAMPSSFGKTPGTANAPTSPFSKPATSAFGTATAPLRQGCQPRCRPRRRHLGEFALRETHRSDVHFRRAKTCDRHYVSPVVAPGTAAYVSPGSTAEKGEQRRSALLSFSLNQQRH